MRKAPKLLPCPFCGEKPGYHRGYDIVQCGNSGCYIQTLPVPVEKWNHPGRLAEGRRLERAWLMRNIPKKFRRASAWVAADLKEMIAHRTKPAKRKERANG